MSSTLSELVFSISLLLTMCDVLGLSSVQPYMTTENLRVHSKHDLMLLQIYIKKKFSIEVIQAVLLFHDEWVKIDLMKAKSWLIFL